MSVGEPAPRKSMDEIAAMMAENTMRMRGTSSEVEVEDEAEPTSEVEAVSVDTDDSDDATPEPIVDDGGDEEPDVVEVGQDDVEELVEEEPVDDELYLSDDDLVELGEESVTLGDLKRLYSADKSILEQVTKQEEATQGALVAHRVAAEEATKLKRASSAVIEVLGTQLVHPSVKPPNETWKTTNPQAYIEAMDAYNADQQRVNTAREALLTALRTHAEQEEKTLVQRKQVEFGLLHQKVPYLMDTDINVKASATKDIMDAAEHYGFSNEDIDKAADHRIFWMAYEAQQYRKMMAQAKGGKVEMETKLKVKQQQTRTLKSKGTSAKTRATAHARRIKTVKAQAVKSGKASDVAAYLAAKRSQ